MHRRRVAYIQFCSGEKGARVFSRHAAILPKLMESRRACICATRARPNITSISCLFDILQRPPGLRVYGLEVKSHSTDLAGSCCQPTFPGYAWRDVPWVVRKRRPYKLRLQCIFAVMFGLHCLISLLPAFLFGPQLHIPSTQSLSSPCAHHSEQYLPN